MTNFTQHQKDLVQTTFELVPDADALAQTFYNRLFEIDPSLRPLFKGDIAEQRKKLMQTLAIVVRGLDSLETIVPAIENLGKRHVVYGVTPQHWHTVGGALLWALNETFGDAFTNEVRDAWASAYTLIADTAMKAAYPEEVDLT